MRIPWDVCIYVMYICRDVQYICIDVYMNICIMGCNGGISGISSDILPAVNAGFCSGVYPQSVHCNRMVASELRPLPEPLQIGSTLRFLAALQGSLRGRVGCLSLLHRGWKLGAMTVS